MVTEEQGKIRKRLLDDLKETRGCWKLKEEALDRTLWRTGCGRGYGPVMKTECGMNIIQIHSVLKLSYQTFPSVAIFTVHDLRTIFHSQFITV